MTKKFTIRPADPDDYEAIIELFDSWHPDDWDSDYAKRYYREFFDNRDPEKTKIVYCKDSFREGNYPNEKLDFLGYTFRSRLSKDRYGRFFVSFLPAVSDEAGKSMRTTIRSWRIHRMTDKSIKDLACMFNPIIRGWINYYGQYYKSALYPIFNQLNGALQRWAMRKYKKATPSQTQSLLLAWAYCETDV